jgi:mRNA export factor
VISGGWDNSIKFWDTRQPNPTAAINLSGKVLGMSFSFPLLVAILSDRQMAVVNVNSVAQGNTNPTIVPDPSIKYQIRSVTTSADAKSVVMGMIEGRCIVKNVSLEPTVNVSQDFTFRCHRDTLAHSLNSVAYNPMYGSFATGGSDGQILLWDRQAKQRLKCYASLGGPVTAMDFKPDSTVLAYAVGYDWHKGHEHANSVQPKIALKRINDDAKPKTASTSSYASYGYRR